MKNEEAIVDAETQTMRCPKCKDEVPIPLGTVAWVTDVMFAFSKAHKDCRGVGGLTRFSKPKEDAGVR